MALPAAIARRAAAKRAFASKRALCTLRRPSAPFPTTLSHIRPSSQPLCRRLLSSYENRVEPTSAFVDYDLAELSVLGADRTSRKEWTIRRHGPDWRKWGKPYPSPRSERKACKDPIARVMETQLQTLDPTALRKRLFSRENKERARVGDILLVRMKNGDPFAGVCLNIRRQGIDTAVLLRNQLTRVGVEMWYKIYSPNVQGIEVVQRRQKRARRARLYYMRQPKHDAGSVQNIANQYIRQRSALRTGEGRRRDASKKKASPKSQK